MAGPEGAALDGGWRTLAGRGAVLVAGQAITWAFAVWWLAVVPRALEAREFGEWVFAFGVLTIAASVGTFGFDVHLARSVARRDPEADQAAALALGSAGAVVAVAAGAAVATLAAPLAVTAALAVGFAALAVGNLAFAVLQGRERPGPRAGFDVVAKGLFLAGSLAAVGGTPSVAGVAAAFAAGYVVYAAGGWAVLVRSGRPSGPITGAQARRVLAETAPLGALGAAQAIYFRADSAMLTPLKGAVATGVYGAAYRLFDSATFVTSVYGAVVSPRLIHHRRHQPDAYRHLLRSSLAAMGGLAVVALAGFVALAEPAVDLLYGDDFAGAIAPLRLLGVALALSLVATPLSWALVAADRQGDIARVGAVAAVLNVAANLVAIPTWGASGAAATTALTEVVVVSLLWRARRRADRPGGDGFDRSYGRSSPSE